MLPRVGRSSPSFLKIFREHGDSSWICKPDTVLLPSERWFHPFMISALEKHLWSIFHSVLFPFTYSGGCHETSHKNQPINSKWLLNLKFNNHLRKWKQTNILSVPPPPRKKAQTGVFYQIKPCDSRKYKFHWLAVEPGSLNLVSAL